MEISPKRRERYCEIVSFFYTIFGNRIREGYSSDEARHEAYDAVELRYEIGRKSLLNIISWHNNSQSANPSVIRQKALALIRELKIVNEGLSESINKNNKLICLLRESIEENDR